ncbi:MAG: hypothetical protein EZS28_029469, partial [Streblomastix strix]
RTQKHIPKSIITEQDIEEYKEYVKSEIIEMQNFNLDSTKQRFAQAAAQKNQQTFIYRDIRIIRPYKESGNTHASTWQRIT